MSSELQNYVVEHNRGEFMANGVHMNKPYNNPNGKIYAILKSDGTIVALDRKQDFSPKIHIRYNPNAIAVQPVQEAAQISAPSDTHPIPPTHDDLRWKQLSEKGWLNLKGQERLEYSALKEKHGSVK